jgi:hypothetical protein
MLSQTYSTLQRILTVSVVSISTVATITTANAIATDIKQGCESLGGTYHALDNKDWMCLYSNPNHNGSLGVYCNQNQQCDRLVYSPRTDGRLTLQWQPITPSERIDD